MMHFFSMSKKKFLPFSICFLCILSLFYMFSRPVYGEEKPYSMNVGDSYIISPHNLSSSSFSISTSPDVVSLQQNIMEAHHPGFTTITYIQDAKMKQKVIWSKGILPANGTLTVHKKTDLHLFGVKQESILNWYSSNPSIATINKEGTLHALRCGSVIIRCKTKQNQVFTTTMDIITKKQEEQIKQFSSHPVSSSPSNSKEMSLLLSSTETSFCMQPGDYYKPQLTIKNLTSSKVPGPSVLTWKSSDTSVATVDSFGTIHAVADGSALITGTWEDQSISYAVNVISNGESGKVCELTLLTGEKVQRNYTLFKQNSYNYSSHNKYIAWHGCSHCSLATVLGAYNQNYSGLRPDELIDGFEKQNVPVEDWQREHVDRPLKKQMPYTMYGMSALLCAANIKNKYIPAFSYKEARSDIVTHLKTGNPIIIEVRKKNSQTGKSDNRWTNSYHTMAFLGIFTNGNVLLCDSIDRSWYEGGQRYKIVALDDVMSYMFSSTKLTTKYFFHGGSSDGGYIKVFDD